MDAGEGSSGGKKRRRRIGRVRESEESDGEAEEELSFTDLEDDEEFDFGFALESSSEDGHSDAEDWPAEVDRDPIAIDEDATAPSAAGSTSAWVTSGVTRNISFKKTSAFYGRPEGATPMDYFNLFFTKEFLQMICDETNRHAERLSRSDDMSIISKISYWTDLTVDELKVFLGLIFHMGTIQMSRLADYWKGDRLFRLPIFKSQMRRNRFLLIMSCMRFSSDDDSKDPLHKIRKVVDYFNEKMNECYYPARELSLYNDMFVWNGQLCFRQYTNKKRHKNSVKLYMLTEPDGLVIKLLAHGGNRDFDGDGENHGEKMVMQLLQEKLNNGHALYLDSLHNSCELARKLLENDTFCTGTLRKQAKDNPEEVIKASLNSNENITRFSRGVRVGKWFSKRPVTYLTTQHSDKMTTLRLRNVYVKKPEALVKYDEFKLDLLSHSIFQQYPCERNTMRWYLKIAIHIFQLLLVNSNKMYNRFSGAPKMLLYNYRTFIIKALLPEKPKSSKSKKSKQIDPEPEPDPAPEPEETNPEDSQFMELDEPPHKMSRITERTKGRTKRKTCRLCTNNKRRRDTIWHCTFCPDMPGLCPDCFENYHAKV